MNSACTLSLSAVPAYSEVYGRAFTSSGTHQAHTINPRIPIESIAYTMPKYPKIGLRENVATIWLIIPNPGRIRMYTSGCVFRTKPGHGPFL